MILLLAPLTTKILQYFKFDSLETKGYQFANISTKNNALKRTNHPLHQTSVTIQKDISPNNILEKLANYLKNNWPQKRKKKKFGNLTTVVLICRESSHLDRIIAQSYCRLKYPLLTTIQASCHWSTDKMKAFMNQ